MLECLEIIFNLQKRKEKSKNMDFKTEVLLSPELHVTSNTENDEPILQYFQFVRDEETPVIEDNNVVFIKYENLLGINDDKLMEESDLNMPSTENTQLESPLLNISNLEPITLLDGSTAYLAMNSEDQYSQLKLSNGDYALVQFQVVQSLPSPLTQDDYVSNEDLIPVEEIVKSKKRAHRCLYDGCGKLYATVHHLKVHERIHTGARPYKCEYQNCNKAFATTYSLKTHFRIHTGEKPYKCTTCEKQFKTSGDLQKHIRIHTGERPFACPYEGCNQSFTTSNIRKVHLRTHTGERPYKCNVLECGKTFVSATNYKNHMRIHSGEKPYFCKEVGCTKRFTEYSSLYKHQIVHQAQKQKVCTMCGKLYRQTSTLLQHMKISHGTYDLNEFTQNIQVDDNHLPISSSSNSADSLSDNIFNSDETNVLGDENDGDGCLETPDNDEVLITDMEGNPVILRKYLKV